MLSDSEFLASMKDLEEKAIVALAAGQKDLTFHASPRWWLHMFEELRDRNPRNYSALVRFDLLDQMHAVLDRLHEEVNYVIAMGPAESVADRYDPRRKPTPRQIASRTLRDSPLTRSDERGKP